MRTTGPVIIVHLEDPPGSGLTACTGLPFSPASDGSPGVPRQLCEPCRLTAREAKS